MTLGHCSDNRELVQICMPRSQVEISFAFFRVLGLGSQEGTLNVEVISMLVGNCFGEP